MKLYFAGYTSIPEVTKLTGSVLESYLTFNKSPSKLIENVKKNNVTDLFLDSGAYSAFTRKAVINIDEYIEFCKNVKDYVKVIANLDVIGNSEETYKNWVYIRNKGVDALPVIHYGADEKYFDIYFKEHQCKHLALGGLVPHARQRKELTKWLDYCFFRIKKYWPIKIHLFGIMSIHILQKYPVYSSDSTSWLMHPAFGSAKVRQGMKMVERDGWKFYKDRKGSIKNIELAGEYLKMQREITKLWELRGIKWTD